MEKLKKIVYGGISNFSAEKHLQYDMAMAIRRYERNALKELKKKIREDRKRTREERAKK